MSELDGVMQRLVEVNKLLSDTQGGAEVIEQVRKGEISIELAVGRLMEIAAKHGLLDKLQEASTEIRSLSPRASSEAPVRPLHMKTSTGITQLNPLFEAALAERAFFDGDVPEFRSGPIPPGGTPAVPVVTDSLDSVVVGEMLLRASTEVAKEIAAKSELRLEVCNRLLSLAEGNAHALEVTTRNLPSVPTGVTGYLAGQTPMLRPVTPPTLQELSSLTQTERAQRVFLSIASTQGRVSLGRAIEKELRKRLEKLGCVVHNPDSPSVVALSKNFWAVEIFGRDVNEHYSPATIATGYFMKKLLEGLDAAVVTEQPPEIWFKVVPLNNIADRQFGWELHSGVVAGRAVR